MWFGTSSSLHSLSPFDKSLAVGDVNLQPVESVRNLGVYFDSELSMKAHVSKTAQVCFFQLRRLLQIRRLLGRNVTSNVVAALVFSCLDYGNALLAGLPHDTRTITAGHQCRCTPCRRSSTA